MGSNMAEAHPVGFQWVMEAKARGTQVVHIDPRFTRTSAVADRHVPLRAGSDIAFLGGVINYILSNELDFREYVAAYTNASFIVDESFRDTEDLDGLFSGYDDETASYDPSSWHYESTSPVGPGGRQGARPRRISTAPAARRSRAAPVTSRPTRRCSTRAACIRSSSGTTPATRRRWWSGSAACRPSSSCRSRKAWAENSGRERTTALVYSVGLDAALGRRAVHPGRGDHPAAAGQHRQARRRGDRAARARQHPGLDRRADAVQPAARLPRDAEGGRRDAGGLPRPHHGRRSRRASGTTPIRTWSRCSRSTGARAATADNDYCFDYMPRINGDHGTYRTVMDMVDGKVFGYFLLGQNPAVGSAHGRLQRLGMANLDWVVVRDLVEIESATFWKDSPEIETGEIAPETCRTEVFLFPAASHVEKAGTFTQTQRMLQWREKAVEPPGDARSELWFFYHLGRILREKLAGSTDERDRPLLDLSWDYAMDGDEPSGEDVLRRINGVDLTTGRAVDNYMSLRADGSTMCGCWIYSGVYADEVNQAARRKPHGGQDPAHSEWGWTWPMNRRVLYNRASADPQGRPWSERKKLVWWDPEKGEWTGHDVPDFEKTKPPDYRPPEGAVGVEALRGDDPFIMQADGKGWLFAPNGVLDGPLPTHYEPHESPVRNALYAQQGNPARKVYGREDNPSNPSPPELHGEVFPFVFTAARLTEHHTAGGMSRQLPYLSELQPGLFVEVSPALAAERGLTHMEWAHVITSRTAVDARVFVTDRHAAAADRRPCGASDLDAVSLGRQRPGRR